MSQLRIPTFSEIMAVSQSRGAMSEAPHLWDGLVGWWPMQAGGGDTAFDASGHGNHGTLTNMDPATDRVVGRHGRALDFDGSNDYVNWSPSVMLDGDYTWSAWLWPRNLGGERYIFSAGYNNDPSLMWYRYESEVRYVENDSGVLIFFSGHGANLTNQQWNFLVGCRVGGTIKMYIDGAEAATTSGGTASSNTSDWQLGYAIPRNKPGSYFPGKMTQCVIHNRALAQSEIEQLYADPWAMGRRRPVVFAAPGISIPVVMHHLRQQGAA